MKMLSTALVVFGLGLAAAYGARNSDSIVERQEALGEARLLNEASARSLTRYCKALARTGQELVAGCPEQLPKETATSEETSADIATLAAAWKLHAEKAGEAAHRAAKYDIVESPGRRFSDWLQQAGGPFLLGIILLVVGAVLARKEARAAALGHTDKTYKGSRDKGAVDFGELLGELNSDLAEANARVAKVAEVTDGDFDELRYLIKNLQYDKFEPLIESRVRVEARFGVAGFAAIFGPLSAGERQMNRAWSALVDRHWGEASESLKRSARSLLAAQEQVERLSSEESTNDAGA
jgi:hypothetical protein